MTLRTCGEVVDYGPGDRYSHTYCDLLPKGHDGPHMTHPAAAVVAKAWHTAYVKEETQAIKTLDDLLATVRKILPVAALGVQFGEIVVYTNLRENYETGELEVYYA
jgi:hypothetical protein